MIFSPQIFYKNQDRNKYNADASTNWNDPKSLDYNHMQYEAWISFDFIAGFCLLSNSFHNCIIYTVRSPRFKVIVHITLLTRFKNQNGTKFIDYPKHTGTNCPAEFFVVTYRRSIF